ncbi:hypothetical protein DFJ74DRAFT_668839 [Hyaloraphidium curvatum]|nr:hypothetical protein DFJ74DRAFT_668839 [Hyaloraphidium curvatum]
MSRCAQRGRHRHLRCADCGAMVTTVANLIKHFMQACPAGPGQAVPEQGAEQEGAEPPPPNEPGIPIDPGTLMDVDPPFNAGNVPFPFLQQLLPVGAAQHQMPQAPLPAEPLFDFTWALINQIPGPVGVLPTAWHLPAAPLLEAGAVQGEPVDPVLFPQPGTPHPADFADGDEDEDAGDWILSSGLMQGLGQLDLEGDDVSNLSCSFDFGSVLGFTEKQVPSHKTRFRSRRALSDRLGIDIDPVGLPALGLPDYSVLMQ